MTVEKQRDIITVLLGISLLMIDASVVGTVTHLLHGVTLNSCLMKRSLLEKMNRNSLPGFGQVK